MNKLGTENSKIMTNKIEVYFCHKVKLTRSSSRACMYIPTQGVKFLFPDDILCVASIAHISSCLKILLEIQSFCPFPVQKTEGKEGPSPLRIFSQKKRERRVKRDNETVFYFMWPRAQSKKTRCLSTLEDGERHHNSFKTIS